MRRALLQTDGGARGNPGPAGIGIVLKIEGGNNIQLKKFIGHATNNQAEYQALLEGMRLAVKERVNNLEIRMDSELIVNQMNGKYRVRDARLCRLFDEAQELVEAFDKVIFYQVPRNKNKEADKLVNDALDENRDGKS